MAMSGRYRGAELNGEGCMGICGIASGRWDQRRVRAAIGWIFSRQMPRFEPITNRETTQRRAVFRAWRGQSVSWLLAEMLLEHGRAGLLRLHAVIGEPAVVIFSLASGIHGVENRADGLASLVKPIMGLALAKPDGSGISALCGHCRSPAYCGATLNAEIGEPPLVCNTQNATR